MATSGVCLGVHRNSVVRANCAHQTSERPTVLSTSGVARFVTFLTLLLFLCPAIVYGQNATVIKGSYAGKDICEQLIQEWIKMEDGGSVRFWPAENVACARMLINRECDLVLRSSEWDYTDKQILPKVFTNWPSEPRQFHLGMFAVGVVVNARNPLRGMLARDLERIFTGECSRWDEIPGSGVRGAIIAYCPALNTNESYIFRIKAMRRNAYGKSVAVIDSRERLLALVAAEPRAIGIILLSPRETEVKDSVRALGIIGTSRVDRKPGSQWMSLEELFPSKPGDPGFRWERAVAPSKATIYDGTYPLVDTLSVFLHPQGSVQALRFCEYAVSGDTNKSLDEHYLFPEAERREYGALRRLADFRLGRGTRLSTIGVDSARIPFQDLATEYVRAKAVIQSSYAAVDADVSSIGAFITGDAGARELLLLGDKPSGRAMELHGEKWLALGVDEQGQPTGGGPEEHMIAGRAAAIIVNPTNKLESLTLGQVQAIFQGDVDDWAIIGGTELTPPAGPGGRPGKLQINLFGLFPQNPATAIFEKEGVPRDKWKRVTLKKDTAEALAAVSMDPQAIAFVDLAAIPATGQSVKIVPIKFGQGEKAKVYLPTAENIKNAMYPLSQRYFLYVHPKASDTAKDFAKFIATCGGSEATPYADTVKAVMETYRKHGLIPLADEAITRAAKDAMAEAAAKARAEEAAKGKRK